MGAQRKNWMSIASRAKARLARRRSAAPCLGAGVESLESRAVLSSVPFIAARLVSGGDEASGANTVFELSRTGSTAAALSVNVALGGTATANSDYVAPANMQAFGVVNVTIPANASIAQVVLPTRVDSVYDPNETIELIVQPGADYRPQPAADRAVALVGADGVAGSVVAATFDSATGKQFRNKTAFAAIRSDGSAVTWGNAASGGNSSGVDFDGPNNNLTVRQMFSTYAAFAAIRSDGSVVTWGDAGAGGNSSGVDFDGPGNNLTVARIFSTGFAFAAMRSDGSIVTWGNAASGGNSSGVDFNGPGDNLKVTDVVSTNGAFAARRSDGSVVAWGDWAYGGDVSEVDLAGPKHDLTVTRIVSAGYGFAALRSDGTVVTWGSVASTDLDFNGPNDDLSVVQIYSTSYAFAALRSDGSVLAWGDADFGGNATAVDFNGPKDDLAVTQIFAGDSAFAALRSDGSVVTWGGDSYGGDSSGVDFDGPNGNLAVTQIVSNMYGFAAIRSNGSVVSWGFANWGGNSSAIDFDGPNNNLSVTHIVSNGYAFAAIRGDGSVVAWGDASYGGSAAGVDFDGPSNTLTVTSVFSTSKAFAAIRSDGSVVSWGDQFSGGKSTGIDFDGPNNNLSVATIASPFLDETVSVVRQASATTITSVAAGSGSASITFTPPADNGGAAVVNYKYSTDNGVTYKAFSPAVTGSPVTISGLANGTTYQIRLRAVNSVGDGVPSSAVAATPATTPAAPSITAVASGNGSATVRFTPPVDNGGAAIVNYKYSTDNGGTYKAFSPAATGSPLTIAGLANGTTYQVRLRAVNSVGDGVPSSAVAVTPATTPAVPSITAVTPGNGSATVTVTPPADNGGNPISNFVVQYSTNSGATWGTFARQASTAPSIAVTGLANGVAHIFRVSAVNGVGTGGFSSVSSVVVPASPPGLPRGLAVVGGNAQASLSWLAPLANGGRHITTYVVRYSTNNGATWITNPHSASAATSITVAGLSNGVRHIFEVAAAHEAGTGRFTAASAAVIPAGPAGAATSLTARRGNGSVTLSWTAPDSNGGAVISNYVVQRSSDGGAQWVTVARAASVATSAAVTGLVNGTSYVFRVAAVTRVGWGAFTSASAAVIPATLPGASRGLTATPGNGRASLAWTAPATNGGVPVANYVVQYSRDNGRTWLTVVRAQSAATSTTVTGLLNGVAHVFRVAAVNEIGVGAFSPLTAGVIPRLSLA